MRGAQLSEDDSPQALWFGPSTTLPGAGKVSLFPSPLHESDEEESSVEVAEHVPAAAVKNTGRVGKQAAGQGMRAARSPTASPASEATEGEEEEAESVAALHAFQLAVHMTQGMAARGVPPASLVLQPGPDPSDPGGADSIQLPGRDLRAGGCAEFDLQLPAASPPAALSLRLEGGGRGARLHVDRLELRREGGAEPVVYSFSRWVTHALVTTAAQEPDRPSCTVAIDVLEVEGRLASGLLHLIFTDAAGVTAGAREGAWGRCDDMVGRRAQAAIGSLVFQLNAGKGQGLKIPAPSPS